MAIIAIARDFYARFERPISSASLVLGFVVDFLTLTRVDKAWVGILITCQIITIGVFIFLIHIKEKGEDDENDPSKAHFWYVNILQFFFGGVLSACLVSYFRSADIFVSWPFILILAIAFAANEVLKRHYIRLSFQISLYYLAVYSFAIFFVPVLLHEIGVKVFLLSGLISLLFISFFIGGLFLFVKDKFQESKQSLILLIGGIFVLVNFLYFTNIIPPIPLSLKDAGVYHSLEKNSAGNYVVSFEDQGWRSYFQSYKKFRDVPGNSAYAFSSIFSPSDLNTTIVHEWEHYDIENSEWVLQSRVYLPVIGGREKGFRTYSTSSNLAEGKWRVNVKTLQGQNIGRLRFRVEHVNAIPKLTYETK